MLCRSCHRQLSRGAEYCGSCGEPTGGASPPLEVVLRDGTRVPLVETVTIGRASGNTIQLADPSISRYHLRFLAEGRDALVEDAGSSHGTFLDGRRLEAPEALRDGMCIELGESILRVERRRDQGAAGRTIVVRPGVTVNVPAEGEAVASSGSAHMHRPRLRSTWALKRLAAVDGETRYVLKDIESGALVDVAAEDAELFELLDGRATLRELVADAERRIGPHAVSRLARLLSELGERGLLEGVEPAPTPTVSGGRLTRLLRPREIAPPGAAGMLERLYARGAFALFTPVSLVLLAGVAVAGLAAFGYLIVGRYGTPFVVRENVVLGGLVFFLGRFVISTLHELAHALTLSSFGRRICKAGFKLLLVFPYSFVDTSDGWFESRGRRLAVSAAGPASDLVAGGSFSLLAAALSSGSMRDVLFQLSFAAYVGALFNLSVAVPGRDGYPLMVDLLRTPKLRQRTQEWLAGRPIVAGDRRAVRIYLATAFASTCAAAAFGALMSVRYYERLATLVPEEVVWIALGVFDLMLFLPLALLVARPLAERVRRARGGREDAIA